MSAQVMQTAASEIAEVINTEALLAPIADENPAGESLQYAGLYDEIREARRADEQFTQGEWRRENKLADWRAVVELATHALETRTKDLQVAVWLAEALVKQEGFAGLRDSLRLVRNLQERFWHELYPEIEDGDLEARANSLAWMDRQLALAIKEIEITNGIGDLQYNFHQYEDAKRFDIPEDSSNLDSSELERLTALKTQAAAEGKITGEQWRAARKTTRRAFVETTYAVLNESWSEFQALDSVMDSHFGDQTPGLGALRRALEEIREVVEKLVREKRIEEPDAASSTGDENSNGDATYMDAGDDGAGFAIGAGGGVAFSGAIRSRAEAFQRLAEVARFFRQTEPHSPVPYLVERAIKWGDMPLEKWLAEVVKSEDVMFGVRDTLGIREEVIDDPYNS